jgi:periplasmic copper chaperone A
MRSFFSILSVLFLATGCQQAPKAAHIDHAWVRLPAVSGSPGAAYFTLHGGPADDRLMTVSSPLAVRAEMHDMSMSGGMASMAAMEAGVELPKGGAVTFAPGGKHVMLFDIAPKAVAGRKLPLTLSFASGATLSAEADIVAAGDEAPRF